MLTRAEYYVVLEAAQSETLADYYLEDVIEGNVDRESHKSESAKRFAHLVLAMRKKRGISISREMSMTKMFERMSN